MSETTDPVPAVRRRVATAVVLVAAAALAVAGCGGGDDSSSSSSATTAETTGSTAVAASTNGSDGTVDLADDATLGSQILVDSKGRTLYLFEKDDSADESYCSGACAKAWPPLTTGGSLSAGSGLDASQLTTFEREDGSTQVAYAGHPLYYYAGDQAAGDVAGNGLDQYGAEWYALDSSGETVEGGESSDDSSGGYSPSY